MNQVKITQLPGAADKPVKQEEPDFSAAGFGRRLNAALDCLGMPASERPAKVAEAGGVTVRTARRYLNGASQPRGSVTQMCMADCLGICSGWLMFGAGFKTPKEAEQCEQFLEAYRKNPVWRQRLIERTLTKMANKSPRVARLMDLQEKGQLSADEFLRLAGR